MTYADTDRIYTGTFAIERVYRHPPEKVFRAFADPLAKAQWFGGGPDWKLHERSQDFRVGGEDRLRGTHKSGMESLFIARYHQIIENRRIVYVYDMRVDGKHLSVSIATIELEPRDGGTRFLLTEQGAYLAGGEPAHRSRREGTEILIGRLDASLG